MSATLKLDSSQSKSEKFRGKFAVFNRVFLVESEENLTFLIYSNLSPGLMSSVSVSNCPFLLAKSRKFQIFSLFGSLETGDVSFNFL